MMKQHKIHINKPVTAAGEWQKKLITTIFNVAAMLQWVFRFFGIHRQIFYVSIIYNNILANAANFSVF